ncbi:PREDICTED: limbic system-associated membrane protein-like [Branchiostoma belcheri]|uniref:Limbic system-associated membrane protein-like n=1 Tax=Branchiostoma belcheri TaxID=7741 RepID=A0A6P4ZV49_BRABE|nr:PREDICTED: limbic system-associated membrane protein-like [Branchiostoma belcheri]
MLCIIFVLKIIVTSLGSVSAGATLVGNNSLTVTRGEDAFFDWRLESTDGVPYQYVWLKKKGSDDIHILTVQLPEREVTDVDSYKDRTEAAGHVGLRLLNVTKLDAGMYLLYVYIHRKRPVSTEITLDVQYPPTNTAVSISHSGGPTVKRLSVKRGDTLRLRCATDSNPTSSFSWTRLDNDREFPPFAEVNTTSGVLTIYGVQRNDTGTYQCRAHNGLLPDGRWHVNITIQYPPTTTTAYIVHPSRGNITKGDAVTLTCRVSDALPSPTFYWERYDDNVARGLPSSAIADEQTGILIIPSVQPRDAGVYRCITDNGVAPNGSALIMLNVTAEPRQAYVTTSRPRITPRWIIPSSMSVAFAVSLSCVIFLWLRKAKLKKNDHGIDQWENVFTATDDYLPEYQSPSHTVALLSSATSEEKMADPVVQEFWDRLMEMDANGVLVFLQEKQILKADDVAGIRQAFSVVKTLLETICVLEKENSARVLSEALRHSKQQGLADLLEGKVLPDAKSVTVTNTTDSTFSIEFKPAYTNVQVFGDVDKYVVTLAFDVEEPQIIETRSLLPSEPLHADFTDLNQGTSYNVTVVGKRGDVTSAGTTLTVTTNE